MSKEFETLEDLKAYAESIGSEQLSESIEAVEECVVESESGYKMQDLREKEYPLRRDHKFSFLFGVVVGTFLEREYPAEE